MPKPYRSCIRKNGAICHAAHVWRSASQAFVMMRKPVHKTLLILLLIYGAASFIHFVHNAEFLVDYPNIPSSWSRPGVYFAWIGLTAIGVAGWILVARGYPLAGLLLFAVYAALGFDSLGHYVLAPLSDHTATMNSTILFEVAAAALALIYVVKQMVQRLFHGGALEHDA